MRNGTSRLFFSCIKIKRKTLGCKSNFIRCLPVQGKTTLPNFSFNELRKSYLCTNTISAIHVTILNSLTATPFIASLCLLVWITANSVWSWFASQLAVQGPTVKENFFLSTFHQVISQSSTAPHVHWQTFYVFQLCCMNVLYKLMNRLFMNNRFWMIS